MPLALKRFQDEVCAGIVARFGNVRTLYDSLRNADADTIDAARKRDGAVVLQAPTGAGKTLIAVEALRRLAREDTVLWFWFAPFAGLVAQSRAVIAAHAPELRELDLGSDRSLDAVAGGGVFVLTWASVAARKAASKLARSDSDAGLSLDALVAQTRAEGLRIGCVVDEAHHGFHGRSAAQPRASFNDVLTPDYTLMMTATPRDKDALAFETDTGYCVGEPADWASVSRFDAVEAGLLKRGVRMVRFIARNGDAAQLVDFEHLAVRECTAMHRRIAQALDEAGIALTPLMLVQVPDGTQAQRAAQDYLINTLGFAESAVRVHTAAEPDPDLIALAADPEVEVLIFKMAVALGFDAPRAFTLAALRGARDASFGVQVIGRIVRRHALLQPREDLPPVLQHGYVFFANAEAQGGLLDAGEQINALTTRAPELGTQTVVTVIGDAQQVQVVRSGEPLSLLVSAEGVETLSSGEVGADPADDGDLAGGERNTWIRAARDLLQVAGDEGSGTAPGTATTAAVSPLILARPGLHRYARRADGPETLRGERLPPPDSDFEARLADFADFSDRVLASRLRTQTQVTRRESGLFDDRAVHEDDAELWASLSPEAVAHKAEQIRMRLVESNDKELTARLAARFAAAIRESGAEVPTDEEELDRQLDLVLVRHPALLREAYKRLRHAQIVDVDAPLPAELHSDLRLEPARRALYGVVPPDLNEDERAVAAMLDASPLVRWWHRNPSIASKPESLGLYRWDDGDGFYPDFVVSLSERETPGGVALVEAKGSQWWNDPHEAGKADARHADYGPVFMIGRERGQRDFVHLRQLDSRLRTDGAFSLDRLRW
jgi:hypothetical protein